MWLNQLFKMMDRNNDHKVTLHELIIACSPDKENDGNISCHEFELGRETAVFWLANIVCTSPTALNDDVIDLDELRSIKQSVSVPSKKHVTYARTALAKVLLV